MGGRRYLSFLRRRVALQPTTPNNGRISAEAHSCTPKAVVPEAGVPVDDSLTGAAASDVTGATVPPAAGVESAGSVAPSLVMR